ncbi:Na+/H+ antiporter NhaC family protein [Sporolactobacillus pectinivorans]|uniref:Na+/H+ antiporter NhaC family protein n=1 Tax=Sporolactobacillus pectinivorans TaxID=1591408 RepID=UPI001EFCD160|nr:Na+/H+ antiporter NhaC family protein [Sporolactobacillus pectinivorans]
MHPSWLSLVPFLLVIPISIFTRQVQPGLFVALLVGSYIIEPSFFGGVHKFLDYILQAIVKPNNIKIILFLYGFSGLLSVIKMAGGIKGFVDLVGKKIKTKKSALALIWISTIGTFSDPDFRIVTVAPIINALQKRLKMSKRQVAYIIDVTSNPIVVLVPIATGFVGFMVSLINTSFRQNGISQQPYIVYIKSIPFNFFSFTIILVGLYYTFFMHSKEEKTEEVSAGPNRKKQFYQNGLHSNSGTAPGADHLSDSHGTFQPGNNNLEMGQTALQTNEHKTGTGSINPATGQAEIPDSSSTLNPTTIGSMNNTSQRQSLDTKSVNDDYSDSRLYHEEYARHLDVANRVNQPSKISESESDIQNGEEEANTPSKPFNLIIPIALLICLTLFLSWWNGRAGTRSFIGAFLNVDELDVMVESVLITLIVTIVLVILQKFPTAKVVTHFINGGNQLMSVIVLLALIWGVSDVSTDLGFSQFITEHVSGWIPPHFVAPILFVLGIFLSYFIGSSWGTWGLLMPLGITLTHQSGANLLLVIGAVFASGTYGATCSPLSDNSVTLCTMMDMQVMKYCKWKLLPTTIAAGLALVLFVIASFIFK